MCYLNLFTQNSKFKSEGPGPPEIKVGGLGPCSPPVLVNPALPVSSISMQLGLVGQQLVGTADRPYVVKQAVFRQRWPTMDGGKAARSAPAQQKKNAAERRKEQKTVGSNTKS